MFVMDDRERASSSQQRGEAVEYLRTVVQGLRRRGMPWLPGARRLGSSRFGAGWGAGPTQAPRSTKS
jgi:hypothetical protein